MLSDCSAYAPYTSCHLNLSLALYRTALKAIIRLLVCCRKPHSHTYQSHKYRTLLIDPIKTLGQMVCCCFHLFNEFLRGTIDMRAHFCVFYCYAFGTMHKSQKQSNAKREIERERNKNWSQILGMQKWWQCIECVSFIIQWIIFFVKLIS